MAFAALRIPIVSLLVVSIGHVPLPWAHQHHGMDDERLSSHAQNYHCQVAECELPDGWHVHFYLFGVSDESLEDGWQKPPAPAGNHFYDDANSLAVERPSNRSKERVSDPERNLTCEPVVASASSRLAALSGSAGTFFCLCLRADNHRYQEFCVLLL